MQFVVNLSLNEKNNCKEVPIIDYVDSSDSQFIYLDELTNVEKAMIDAEITDDLKLRLLSILFAFNPTANQIKRASALVSFQFSLILLKTVRWSQMFLACSHGLGVNHTRTTMRLCKLDQQIEVCTKNLKLFGTQTEETNGYNEEVQVMKRNWWRNRIHVVRSKGIVRRSDKQSNKDTVELLNFSSKRQSFS